MDEAVTVACPHCGRRLQALPSNLNKQAKCPGCAEVFSVTPDVAVPIVRDEPTMPVSAPRGPRVPMVFAIVFLVVAVGVLTTALLFNLKNRPESRPSGGQTASATNDKPREAAPKTAPAETPEAPGDAKPVPAESPAAEPSTAPDKNKIVAPPISLPPGAEPRHPILEPPPTEPADIEKAGTTASVPLPGGPAGEVSCLKDHAGAVNCVAFSRDGCSVISGGDDGKIILWDVKMGKPIRTLEGHKGAVKCLAVSPDGTQLASGGADKTVRVWDLKTGKLVRTLEGHTKPVVSVAFSPDGEQVASGSEDWSMRAWDIEVRSDESEYPGYIGPVYAVGFLSDGMGFISVSQSPNIIGGKSQGGTVCVQRFALAEGKLRMNYIDTELAQCATLSADERYVLLGAGCKQDAVILLDLRTGRILRRFEMEIAGENPGGAGGANWIGAVAFSPDGKLALAGGQNKKDVYAWETETGKRVARFLGHTDAVQALAVAPDGKFAVSGGKDGTVRIWRLPPAGEPKGTEPAPKTTPEPKPEATPGPAPKDKGGDSTYDGEWEGKFEEADAGSFAIALTVEKNRIVRWNIIISVTENEETEVSCGRWCDEPVTGEFRMSMPVSLDDKKVTFELTGRMSSASNASGTLKMSMEGKSETLKWSAVKKALKPQDTLPPGQDRVSKPPAPQGKPAAAPKDKDDKNIYDGEWEGTTADGNAISFTVKNRALTKITVPTDCEGTAGALKGTATIGPNEYLCRIKGDKLSYSYESTVYGEPANSWQVSGRFESSDAISGTLTIIDERVGCDGYTVKWSAKKKAAAKAAPAPGGEKPAPGDKAGKTPDTKPPEEKAPAKDAPRTSDEMCKVIESTGLSCVMSKPAEVSKEGVLRAYWWMYDDEKTGAHVDLLQDAGSKRQFEVGANNDDKGRQAILKIAGEISTELRDACSECLDNCKRTGKECSKEASSYRVHVSEKGITISTVPGPSMTLHP
jgi:WD40 repeat protein